MHGCLSAGLVACFLLALRAWKLLCWACGLVPAGTVCTEASLQVLWPGSCWHCMHRGLSAGLVAWFLLALHALMPLCRACGLVLVGTVCAQKPLCWACGLVPAGTVSQKPLCWACGLVPASTVCTEASLLALWPGSCWHRVHRSLSAGLVAWFLLALCHRSLSAGPVAWFLLALCARCLTAGLVAWFLLALCVQKPLCWPCGLVPAGTVCTEASLQGLWPGSCWHRVHRSLSAGLVAWFLLALCAQKPLCCRVAWFLLAPCAQKPLCCRVAWFLLALCARCLTAGLVAWFLLALCHRSLSAGLVASSLLALCAQKPLCWPCGLVPAGTVCTEASLPGFFEAMWCCFLCCSALPLLASGLGMELLLFI
ncbi:hypothetical protein NDU88_000567 [Pleurodeles waltl]|uniref:Uncharacterized protein n=1 Tax=Pleurodeles waltl TaxID=8319 RepID=A0AAV7U4C5_PLEWA|nr:hypothetical protein NDU88_000567 [Pleurodeles waltl]